MPAVDGQAVVDALLASGKIRYATWEYPGYVCIPWYPGSWNFGTADGHWGGDHQTKDGRCLAAVDLGLPPDARADEVADAILNHLRGRLSHG